MKSWRTLAGKELWAGKITSILILIALILSTMMTTVIGQSIGILAAMREQQAAYLNGDRHVTLHHLASKQAEALVADSRLSYAGKMIYIGAFPLPNSNISTQLREYEDNAFSAYGSISQLESGCLPEQAGEIALPRDVLSMLGFAGTLGDTITLDAHVSLLQDTEVVYEYTHDFVLTGILKPNYLGYVSGTANGIVGSGTAEQILPDRYFCCTPLIFAWRTRAHFKQRLMNFRKPILFPIIAYSTMIPCFRFLVWTIEAVTCPIAMHAAFPIWLWRAF